MAKESCYGTLEGAKYYADIEQTQDDWDSFIKDALVHISREIDDHCKRHFYERSATYYYDFEDALRLWLGRDLLSITTFTNGDSNTLTENTDFYSYPLDGPPYRWLDIARDSGSLFQWSGSTQRAINIDGLWGYHKDFSNAWKATGDSVQDVGQINATVTTVTVTDASDFKTLQTIKIDDEQMMITAWDEVLEELTVERALNGTTPAIHAHAAAITIWEPHGTVVRAINSWTAFLLNTASDSGMSRLRTGDFESAISFFLIDYLTKGPPGDVWTMLRKLEFKDYRSK